jgi:hypothetical protein
LLSLGSWIMLCASAFASTGMVVLDVGVHRKAGSVDDIQTVGASGECEQLPSRLRCPADGPVDFRWAGAPEWELQGTQRVHPGERGTAFVLASEASRAAARTRLQAVDITAEEVNTLFLQIGPEAVPAPSLGMIDDLATLRHHEDKWVRRAVVDAFFPLMRDAASDHFWPHAPDSVPSGLLIGLTQDRDRGVRRRLALLLREGRSGSLDMERQVALRILATDPIVAVRRPAVAALPRALQQEIMPEDLAWQEALGRVPLRLGPGRAAVGALARMATLVEPSEVINPVAALDLTMRYHPERAWVFWAAWREVLPFHAGYAERLLRRTAGLNPALLSSWADDSPDELAVVIQGWAAGRPTSRRFELAQDYLNQVTHEGLREALRLPPSVD